MLYTENYQFRKPIIGVDIADVKDVNFNSDKLDALLYNTQISLAPAYDLLETYNTGDIVMYETLMYKCKEDNVTGAWDPSKWERTTAGEEGSGGGGSSVVPNPQGEPTDTLNTIGIDGTIFDIAGSGGGSAYRETTLWSGSDSATMQLSESFENYDAIMLVGKNTYNNVDYSISGIWLTSYLKAHINDGMRFGLANDSWYVYFSIADETTFTKQDQYSVYISEIKGLKFAGGCGTGGGLERTLLWDYVTDNNNVIPYGLYTETLHDDIDNYDFIVAEIVSSSGDLSASGWQGTNLWTIDVNALNNAEVQNYLNYTSFGERSSRFYIKDTTFQKTTDNQGNTNGLVRVYGLKWTGGGSGGDSSYTEVSLFTGTSRVTNMTLSESIKNFDAIEFQAAWMYNGLPYHISSIITSKNLSVDNYFIIGCNDYRYVELLVVDDTHINWVGGSDNIMYMKEIKGIKYGSGSGGSETSKYIPYSNKNNIVCEATLNNFDASSLEWGDGESPIILSQTVSMYNNEAVSIPVNTSGVIAYSDVGGNKQPFTAYIVCKAQTSGTYTRLLSALESHTTNMGAMIFGTNNINMGSWNGATPTGLSATSDYIVCAIQYTGYGLGYCKVNNMDLSPFPLVGSNRYITIGRTDTGNDGDQEPCDILVKYFGVVEGTDTRKAINENIAYLMDKFGIN